MSSPVLSPLSPQAVEQMTSEDDDPVRWVSDSKISKDEGLQLLHQTNDNAVLPETYASVQNAR